MSIGKCRKCGKATDNFIEYSDWWRTRYPDDGDGYWKCPECVAYDIALHEWENELSGCIQSEVRDFADPASCNVTQEVAEIELIEE